MVTSMTNILHLSNVLREHRNLSTYHTPEEEKSECKKVFSEYADLNFSYRFYNRAFFNFYFP